MVPDRRFVTRDWLIDIDGTVLEHQGYLRGADRVLPGAQEFWQQHIRPGDRVVLLTAREEALADLTTRALREAGLRFDVILFGMGAGDRVLVNDLKPWSDAPTAHALNVTRDGGL